MRNLNSQIAITRQRTRTPDYSETVGDEHGIPQQVFIEVFNGAQGHLQTAIRNVYSQMFVTVSEVNVVANQEAYTVPYRVFMGGSIIRVRYSENGFSSDYQPLRRGSLLDRTTDTGTPSKYIVQDGQILLNCIPNVSRGKIEVTYIRSLDDLDISRGTVSGTPSGATITVSGGDDTSLPENLGNANYVCISDKLGNVMLRAARVSSFSTATLTLAANVSTYLVAGYALSDLAGGIITLGQHSTTTSKLPHDCERYLLTYAQKRILTIGESNTSVEEDMELKMMETEILKAFNDEVREPAEIPVLDIESFY